MKNSQAHWENKLWAYLDGSLPADEHREINDVLRENEELRDKLQDLRAAEHLLRTTRLREPSDTFTRRIMTNLDRTALAGGLSVTKSIFLLAGILVTTAIAVWLLSAGYFSSETTVDLNNLKLPARFVPEDIPGFSIDGKTIVNAIVFLSLGVAFVLLDRGILRPLFGRRLQTGA